jgi:hypothetical protein
MNTMTTTQQRLEEIAAQEKQLADERTKLLAASKDADLETVKRLCKQHGFTATQLRSSLKTKGKKKETSDVADTNTIKKMGRPRKSPSA